MSMIQHFRLLHSNDHPLIIGNVWDANSAKIFQENGYLAVATSSAALANTFGFEDGESLPFETLLSMVRDIVSAVNIPVSVDMEGGYARDAIGLADNIERLFDIGVIGVNLEDSVLLEERKMLDIFEFQNRLTDLKSILDKRNIEVFINLRTDPFLLRMIDALEETLNRIKAYEAAGMDGIFVPCITDINDISTVVSSTYLPVNVMAMPELPDFIQLQKIGVKRISMGNFLHQYLHKLLNQQAKSILENHSFSAIF